MRERISENFLGLSQEQKEDMVEKFIAEICATYCCGDNSIATFVTESKKD